MATIPPSLQDDDYCYLTTKGRLTGRGHTIEIWFAATDGGSGLYLLAGGGHRSDWVRNLMADPRVSVRVGNQVWQATARVVEDAAEAHQAATAVFEKYQPRYRGDLAGWRTTALPVAVALQE